MVDEAAGALRKLNQLNTPPLPAKLRQLKEKRGWSHDQFLKEAAPLVRDDTITGFDQKSEEFLARITSGGQSDASQSGARLRAAHRVARRHVVLVETQKAKWAYMFAKIDQELTK